MSKPVFSSLFSFRGRRNRKSYFLYGLVIGLPLYLLGEMALAGTSTVSLVAAVLLLPLLVTALATGAQRCHDIGKTHWILLLLLVPIAGQIFAIYLTLRRGNVGANRYGPDPLEPDASAP